MAELSEITTYTEEQIDDLIQDASGLYALYNLIGRGKVSEIEWVAAYINDELKELIKGKCDG